MKNYLLSFLTILLAKTISCQIPNASFENWTAAQPNGWTAMFTQPYSPYTFETPSTNAYAGTKALKSEVLQMPTPTVFIASGVYTGSSTTNYYVPIGPKPSILYGWFIFQKAGFDYLSFNISVKSGGTVVGTGSFTTATTNTIYTQFIMNITYTSVAVPDSFRIGLSINDAGPQFTKPGNLGTYLIVDNLSFDVNVGVNKYNLDHSLQMFPNPTSDQLIFQLLDNDSKIENIEIYDAKGSLVSKNNIADKIFIIDVNNYSDGIYLAKVKDKNGQTTTRRFIRTPN